MPAVQALNVTGTLTDTFTALTADGTAQIVTITINGANDAAVITGTVTGDVTEAGGVNNGTPGHADRDRQSQSDRRRQSARQLGRRWRPAPQHQRLRHLRARRRPGCGPTRSTTAMPTVQALNGTATLTDSFTALTADGTAQVVTITINGANDAAVITGTTSGTVTEAGGVTNGTPGTPDRDRRSQRHRRRQSGQHLPGGGGRHRQHQRLRQLRDDSGRGVDLHARRQQCGGAGAQRRRHADRHASRRITADGTAQLVTITINGANDAAVISGTASGNVTEAGGVDQRHARHADRDRRSQRDRRRQSGRRAARRWRPAPRAPTATAPTRSTAAGRVDLHARQQQCRGAGAQRRRHTDRHASRSHTRRRHRAARHHHHQRRQRRRGDHRRPRSGTVTRSRRRHQRHAGHADRDRHLDRHRRRQSGQHLSRRSARPTASVNGYGSFAIDAAGAWTYTLNNSNAAVQALNVGGTLTDTFTVHDRGRHRRRSSPSPSTAPTTRR